MGRRTRTRIPEDVVHIYLVGFLDGTVLNGCILQFFILHPGERETTLYFNTGPTKVWYAPTMGNYVDERDANGWKGGKKERFSTELILLLPG